LETALGVSLVSRERDGVVLTEIGAQALADAETALRAVERLHQRCSAYRDLAVGTLRVGSVGSVAAKLLPGPLKALRDQHPALEVDLFEGTDEEVAEWALEGVVDVGFTAETRSGLAETVIASDEYVAVLPKDHPAKGKKRMALSDLGEEPFVMPGASCEPSIRAMFDEAGASPKVACTVRGTSSLLSMVSAGIGVTIVPELSLPDDRSEFAIVKFQPPIIRHVLAVTVATVKPTPGVQALLTNLAATKGPR
jgi:DNA-binding transcriptional LysR family regulator